MASLYGTKRVPSSTPRRIRTSEVSAAEARRFAWEIRTKHPKSRSQDVLNPEYLCTWDDIEVQNDWNMMSKEQEIKIQNEVETALYYQQRARERKARDSFSSSDYEKQLRELAVLNGPVPDSSWVPSSTIIPIRLPFIPGHYNPKYPMYFPVPNPMPIPKELYLTNQKQEEEPTSSLPAKHTHKRLKELLLSMFSPFRARAQPLHNQSEPKVPDSDEDRILDRRNSMIVMRRNNVH